MKLKNQKGFTLIELLVVIAIIGLLAGIVLVSLGGARDSARDARVQGAFSQLKSVAELVYNDAGASEYDDLCETTGNTINNAHADASIDPQLDTLEADVVSQTGNTPACYAVGNEYCVSVDLNSGDTLCIDDSGKTSVGTTDCAAATTACP